MNIISYRGPGMAGGVSTALARLLEDRNIGWVHLGDATIKMSFGIERDPVDLGTLAPELIDGHYRFCNEFLWPVLHDLPQYASFCPEHFAFYKKFNQILSRSVANSKLTERGSDFFIQDYQMALTPQILRRMGAGKTILFWHIPWPKFVEDSHAQVLSTIAKGMLSADTIGFHTDEYGRNFLAFVERHVPGFRCRYDNMRISRIEPVVTGFIPSYSYGFSSRDQGGTANFDYPYGQKRSVQILTSPLGLDFDHWSNLANDGKTRILQPALGKKRYVLSVDRADYTKGVTNRISAIDVFFDKYPQWRGEIVFAQICNRTRGGLASFDYYWDKCHLLGDQLKEKWSTGCWDPLVWFEKPFSAPQLSYLYKNADVMLVNPVRDGLNLTAKEFTACQNIHGAKGVLALSRGAGAWHELGSASIEVDPQDPAQMADAIHNSLIMPIPEKEKRMEILSHKVRANTLESWWSGFSPAFQSGATASSKSIG